MATALAYSIFLFVIVSDVLTARPACRPRSTAMDTGTERTVATVVTGVTEDTRVTEATTGTDPTVATETTEDTAGTGATERTGDTEGTRRRETRRYRDTAARGSRAPPRGSAWPLRLRPRSRRLRPKRHRRATLRTDLRPRRLPRRPASCHLRWRLPHCRRSARRDVLDPRRTLYPRRDTWLARHRWCRDTCRRRPTFRWRDTCLAPVPRVLLTTVRNVMQKLIASTGRTSVRALPRGDVAPRRVPPTARALETLRRYRGFHTSSHLRRC